MEIRVTFISVHLHERERERKRERGGSVCTYLGMQRTNMRMFMSAWTHAGESIFS
jgi:hypothetical protein